MAILKEAKARSADSETLISELLKYLNQPVAQSKDDNLNLILGHKRDILKRLETAINLLALENLAARIAQGVQLQKMTPRADRIHLLQVYYDNRWVTYNPQTASVFDTKDILIWWYGKKPLVTIK